MANKRPSKSLRTLLIVWFLAFSIVPLAFIMGYSLVKFEQALDFELSKRLVANSREITITLNQLQQTLLNASRAHTANKTLIYDLVSNNNGQARELTGRWLQNSLAQRIWVYNRDGRLEIAMYKDSEGESQRKTNLEGVLTLNEAWLKRMDSPNEFAFFKIMPARRKTASHVTEGSVEMTLFSKVKAANGRLVGFIEESIRLDDAFLQAIKDRMNVEIFFFQPEKTAIVATHEDLSLHRPETFQRAAHQSGDRFFEFNIRDNPYRFMLAPVAWGQDSVTMGVGASKSQARAVLQNINNAFYGVVGVIVFLLIVLSIIISKVLLRPIEDVLNAIESSDFDKELVQIPSNSSTELGLLTDSFNELSRRTFESQKALKGKVSELETANQEIRDTQSRLVHAAKMAGLGQLVAGVAHELNNPIGFIYSNMSSLRDYSTKLLHLVRVAEEEPEKLEKEVKKADLAYIEKDLPKLIASCEDGARRTRDIVLGLRNFSRLEEATMKTVDIHEGLESTLKLLTGEWKNRIQVHKEFGKLPKVACYPGELNQVFMNILSNATQAIEGEGEIFIKTKTRGKDKIEISIRDTGKGMSKATLEKIFDPFFTTKASGQGTGLGMSISYGVVQKHGGEILVESSPRKGSEFTVILPVKAVLAS
jgi:two-component system, NtrC family, sensor kinase